MNDFSLVDISQFIFVVMGFVDNYFEYISRIRVGSVVLPVQIPFILVGCVTMMWWSLPRTILPPAKSPSRIADPHHFCL